MRLSRHANRRRRESGVTLVELLVSMFLLGVVSTLVVGAVVQVSQIFVHNDDENRGLQDAKVILERLGRDIREARAVVCDDPTTQTTPPRCADHLQVWVDGNSDYVEQPDEVVTWRVVPSSGEHFDVERVVGSGPSAQVKVVATSLIVGAIFEYPAATQPEDAQIVNVRLTYDALTGIGTKTRYADFSARLRNG